MEITTHRRVESQATDCFSLSFGLPSNYESYCQVLLRQRAGPCQKHLYRLLPGFTAQRYEQKGVAGVVQISGGVGEEGKEVKDEEV